jgi:hypothetical protein
MSQLEILISRLSKVRRTTADSWQACCPAHDDKHPSLSIKETEDGIVLIHCFAGCTVHEVVAATGLDISDLFPPREHRGKPERRPFPAMDALRGIAFEALVASAAASDLADVCRRPHPRTKKTLDRHHCLERRRAAQGLGGIGDGDDAQ